MSTSFDNETPLRRLYHWEKNRPDVIHFTQPVGGGRVVDYTWREALDQVRRMAAHLRSLNFPPQSQIALFSKNSAHWMMADWAIWMAGHVTVPLYPSLNAETIRYILEHSESKLLFLGPLDEWEDMRPGIPAGLARVSLPFAPATDSAQWDDIIARTEPLKGTPDRDRAELATIIYTSGSTGFPKGVMHCFNTFGVVGSHFKTLIPIGEEDRMLSYLPLAHALERVGIENLSTYYGCRVFFSESLATFVADLRRAAPTFFLSVPRLWTKFQLGVFSKVPKEMLDALLANPDTRDETRRQVLEQLGLQHVRFAGTGSAPLPATTIAWYRDLGLELLEGYGMSENFAYSHFNRPGQTRLGYVGHADPGVECRIAENGEIQVKSPGDMMGYFKEPEKSREAFTEDGFLKTGDMGQLDEEGRLKITGRVKELFKTSKGKYVAPVPIENKLGYHSKIEVVLVGGNAQPATFALIQLAADAKAPSDRAALEAELSDLVDRTNATLDPHEQMEFAVLVKDPWTIESGFLTPTMKVKRSVIEARYEPKVEGWFKARRKIIWED